MSVTIPSATRLLAGIGLIALIAGISARELSPRSLPQAPAWAGYGGDAQHSNLSRFTASPLGHVKWMTNVDMFPQYAGSAHYASPAITFKNTVVVGVKTGETDGFQIEAHAGTTGASLWTLSTDYSLVSTQDTYWYSVYPFGIVNSATVVAAAGGGSILVKKDADDPASTIKGYNFYQPYSSYLSNPRLYAGVKICTAVTPDTRGCAFFGYVSDGTAPSNVQTVLGTGGFVRFHVNGTFSSIKASSLIPGATNDRCRPVYNAAPVESQDKNAIYVAVADDTRGTYYLVKLDSWTLQKLASVQLYDPNSGSGVWECPCGSGSPIVAPDGQVFYGVMRSYDPYSRGFMLQFDRNLAQSDSTGKRFPVGSFGWDDTPSIVPSSACAMYHGRSPYLILTKYNFYRGAGGTGRNKLAILDPKRDDASFDPFSRMRVMNEVITVLGTTCDTEYYACNINTNPADPNVPVREWCINAAAVDPSTHSALINSEDGHAYRWDLDHNVLTQGTYLQPATGEPYTPTAVGPDGTVYAINNARLHAIGTP